ALPQEAGQFVLERARRTSPAAGRPTGSGRRIGIVHLADRKTDLAVAHVEHLHLDDVVRLQVLIDVVDVRVRDLRDVHQAGLSLTQLDEGAEVGNAGDPPLHDAANFNGHTETNSSPKMLPCGNRRPVRRLRLDCPAVKERLFCQALERQLAANGIDTSAEQADYELKILNVATNRSTASIDERGVAREIQLN